MQRTVWKHSEEERMSDWSAGYVADIGYTFGYYQELNPQRIKLAFLNAGLAVPDTGTACELGFGQGMSANLHAAASVTEWHGTDFNPSQAAFARELAGIAGAGAKLHDEAFADFARRPDLPDFDFIGLHGIWSWISDENRAVIVDFIRRKLKVGGVLYISYNTMPGWAAFGPIRHLMTEHADVLGSEGRGIISRIDGAIDFADRLLATNPLFLRANPGLKERFGRIKDQNRHYLAHEYFNRDWHPMHFATMADWLEPAKLQFACSAHYLDHVDAINLTPDQIAFLKDIPDPMFRESTRDFMVNQQFRRDYWVKGLRRLSAWEQGEELRKQRFMLAAHRPDVSLKTTGSLGEATMSAEVYGPVLDVLADHKSRTLGQIELSLKDANIQFNQLLQAVLVLTGQSTLVAVQDDAVIAKARKPSDRLNMHLKAKARGGGDVTHLASPVTGGGVSVNRFQQLFLLAADNGRKQPAEWAEFAWQLLAAQGQKLIKDGKPIESAEDNLAELTAQAKTFAEKQLPVLKALGVA
jgi:SAM-dependent methyltransferase